MHFCKATIEIGGDKNNIAVRTEYNPVSWPEVEILVMLHGEESISEVIPFVSVEYNPRAEKNRLQIIYGEETVAKAWGRKGPSEMQASGARLTEDLPWLNPITNRIETTGKGGVGSVPYLAPPPPPSEAFETRPAVETVGQPMAGDPDDLDSAFDPDVKVLPKRK